MSKLHGGKEFTVRAMALRPDRIDVQVTDADGTSVRFKATCDELINLSRKILAMCNQVKYPPNGRKIV